METHPCFNTLDRAIGAYRAGRTREALALSEAAWKMAQEIPGAPSHAGVVCSWYGFFSAIVDGRTRRGLELCRSAAKHVFWEPRIYEHLARLEIAGGSRFGALDAVRRGLKLAPDDADLRAIRKWLGVRRRPPIRFLDRTNPLNRMFGRLSAKLDPIPADHDFEEAYDSAPAQLRTG